MVTGTDNSAILFNPDHGKDEVIHFFSMNVSVEEKDYGHTWILKFMNERDLDYQALGRILIINGKCRNLGIKLIVQCSFELAKKLSQYQIDRLAWIEGVSC
jgi:hypothetical protein